MHGKEIDKSLCLEFEIQTDRSCSFSTGMYFKVEQVFPRANFSLGINSIAFKCFSGESQWDISTIVMKMSD